MDKRKPSILKSCTVVLLATVLFVIMMNKELVASLWLDEFTSLWVISNGLKSVFTRAFIGQGQSGLYYFLLGIWTELFGKSEIALRSFSIALIFISALALHRIALRYFSPTLSAVAVLFFFCMPCVSAAATQARPYAASLALASLSTLFLIRSVEQSTMSRRLLYSLSMITLVLLHPCFGGLAVVHWLYFFLRSRSLFRSLALFLPTIIGYGFLVPQILFMNSLKSNGDPWPVPLLVLTASIFSYRILIALSLVLIVLLRGARVNASSRKNLGKAELITFLVLSTFPPILLFILSTLLNTAVFYPRYWSYQSIGFALLLTAGVQFWPNSRTRGLFGSILFIILVIPSPWRHPITNIGEDWRGMVGSLNKDQGSADPLLLSSGLGQSNEVALHSEQEWQELFLSPLHYYQVLNPSYTLPARAVSAQQKEYLRGVVEKVNQSKCVYYLSRWQELSLFESMRENWKISSRSCRTLLSEGGLDLQKCCREQST